MSIMEFIDLMGYNVIWGLVCLVVWRLDNWKETLLSQIALINTRNKPKALN